MSAIQVHLELGETEYRLTVGDDRTDIVPYGEVVGLQTAAGYIMAKVNDPDKGDFNAYALAGPNLTSGLVQLPGTTKEDVEFPDDDGDEGEGEDGAVDDDGDETDDGGEAEGDEADGDDTGNVG